MRAEPFDDRPDPAREVGWEAPPRPWAVPATDLGAFALKALQCANLVYIAFEHPEAFSADVRERAKADLQKLNERRP
jgi:hypothetical protein